MKTFQNDADSVRRYLDAKAEEFSNFEDYEVIDDFEDFEDYDDDDDFEDFEDYEVFDDYIGADDEFLDYGGNGVSFAAHNQGFRTASIQISVTANNSKVTKLQLFGDLLVGAVDSSKPIIKEGTIASETIGGTDTATITGSGSPKSINQLLAWLQQQPTILQGMQIATSQTTILSSIIERYETSPFRDMSTDPINLSVFRNEYQYQTGLLTIPKINQVISNQNYWYISIPTGTAFTMTINLYFGAALNNATALQNKMTRAMSNITRMGGSKVVNAITTGNVNGVGSTALTTTSAITANRTTAKGRAASNRVLRQQQRAERRANRQANRAARRAARQNRRKK